MICEQEKWKDISGYEGHYRISNKGNVMSLKKVPPFLMCPAPTLKGYLRIKLTLNGIPKTISVHRLVAENFIPNLEKDKNMINHKNGIKNDNCVENLEWVNNSQNVKHSFEVLGKTSPFRKKVGKYSIDGEFLDSYNSLTDAGRINGIVSNSIGACCNEKRKTAGGFKWKFL